MFCFVFPVPPNSSILGFWGFLTSFMEILTSTVLAIFTGELEKQQKAGQETNTGNGGLGD